VDNFVLYFIHTLRINLSTLHLNLNSGLMIPFLSDFADFVMTDVDNLVRMATRSGGREML